MAEASPDTVVVKIIGPLITAVIGAAIAWLGLTGVFASAVTALFGTICGLAALAFHLMYQRYVGVLAAGGRRKGSPVRGAYDRLRESLTGGNLAERLYAERLMAFLDAVDRFFGDAGMAERTLFPHAFWLRTPAPLWTASALDRCLLLALIYPVVSIFCVWAISGHVGPVETTLGLQPDITGWKRGIAVAALGLAAFGMWFISQDRVWMALLPMAGGLFAFVAVFDRAVVTGIVILLAFGFFVVSLPFKRGPFEFADVAGAVGVAVPIITIGMNPVLHATDSVLITWTIDQGLHSIVFYVTSFAADFGGLAGAIIGFIVGLKATARYLSQGFALFVFIPAMILVCLSLSNLLSALNDWWLVGPILLFLGLLTLINAPFDWVSLGLTRALLRRGLEVGGWWPYVLAVVDAILAAGIIAVLAIIMVLGTQTFDHLAAHGGGTRILPLGQLFDGLAAHPSSPEYWWLYALLLSTMIPSLINLMIGGASLLRGVPGLPAILLGFMPSGKAVPQFDRSWIALVLAGQVFLGALLGIAAQAFLAVGVIFYILPWVGLGLLETAREVANFDLPGRALALWWGSQ
jgi:hypothetical protein